MKPACRVGDAAMHEAEREERQRQTHDRHGDGGLGEQSPIGRIEAGNLTEQGQ